MGAHRYSEFSTCRLIRVAKQLAAAFRASTFGRLVVRSPTSKWLEQRYQAPRRFEWTPLVFKEVRLTGSNGCGMDRYDQKHLHGFDAYFDLLQKGALNVHELVTHIFGLGSYRQAFAAANKKSHHDTIKVLIDPHA